MPSGGAPPRPITEQPDSTRGRNTSELPRRRAHGYREPVIDDGSCVCEVAGLAADEVIGPRMCLGAR